MRVLSEKVDIEAPIATVWEVLADFGGVADWAPYMKTCRLIGEQTSGVGMRRGMRHAWGFRFEERVTDWTDGQGFSFDVLRAPFPMTQVRESWVITGGNGETRVVTQVNYEMQLGPAGKLLDWLMVQYIVRREMRTGLLGLKRYIEQLGAQGETVNAD
jgi:ligand-binding SRPBCC domain-containing protein